MLLCGTTAVMAQNSAGDYSAGTTALATVTEEIAKYVPIMVKLCYAIAGVVAIVGAISVYIAMNNEEQDVKKKIMMVVRVTRNNFRLPMMKMSIQLLWSLKYLHLMEYLTIIMQRLHHSIVRHLIIQDLQRIITE